MSGKCDKSVWGTLGKIVLVEMLGVVLHCVSGEMRIFVSQGTFTNVEVSRPAAGLDIGMVFGGLSISLRGRGCVIYLI